MALNPWIFNSPTLTINTSRFFLPFAVPWFSSSDFILIRATKKIPASEFSYITPRRRLSVKAFKERRENNQTRNSNETELERELKTKEMTIKPAVRISERKLIVKDRTILTGVPDNVIATSGSSSGPVEGVFLGAVFEEEQSRQVVPLGTLRDVRFMACFRFKLWWMAQMMGDKGKEIPLETQFLLLETKDGSHLESDDGNEENQIIYTVFLPLIEGSFRACLQGNGQDELELCLESGDADTKASSFTHSVFIHAGTDPFDAIADAMKAVKLHLNTFRLRQEKKLPAIVDYFGWCTWDAFYQEVTQDGVEAGLKSLSDGGAPPKFVIIDDGWQSVAGDPEEENEEEGEKQPKQPPLQRLTAIRENSKFQNKEDPKEGIKNIVSIAKNKYGLKYVYVWHAITGYWGGLRPGVKDMEEYGSLMQYPKVSKGVFENEPLWKTDALALQGLGLMNPKSVYKFYNELHSYLASAGVDGVKVDAQCILETLGAGFGGRVELTRQYHQALDASVARNFADNGIIACMSHNTDALYCAKQTAVVRASDDFFPRDPVSHTIHIAAVAYNSVFLGEIMLPDWDMFHSLHPAAEYHASARAISGGPVYVSDAPGNHNFELLKKLVLPDGSVLRARLPGRPTRDCLFSDPARDGVSLLKIWNLNKFTGVVGIYNCQGAAWNSRERKNTFHDTNSDALTGYVKGRDVHAISEVAADSDWNGDCAFYRHLSGELVTLPYNSALPVSLKVLAFDVFTITPIKVLAPGFTFAPIGLIDMFNAGGAIEGLKYEVKVGSELAENPSSELVGIVHLEVKGCGRFGAYSSAKPRRCTVDSSEVEFGYESESGLVTFGIDKLPEGDLKVHDVKIEL
ncbi:probable galactinol--sucrose galactosyltransferase 6 isoform X1 [Cucurbita pepo subsp. pepo]|uniref:probable galactinol--sucrose galactosyltransferase 6 isoform X1 n=2 Tax=Cucurbita pepo subsp. pepo TaxID=3664 RepID=UPI000C9D59BF|nr:probable galactinol--sucrose galactosyltransferase 6 isoform X1 [Cucurbita pepo subsp. pepo]